jgi:hypothetical protein
LAPRSLPGSYYFQQFGESALRSIGNSSRCWRWGFDTVLIRCIGLRNTVGKSSSQKNTEVVCCW